MNLPCGFSASFQPALFGGTCPGALPQATPTRAFSAFLTCSDARIQRRAYRQRHSPSAQGLRQRPLPSAQGVLAATLAFSAGLLIDDLLPSYVSIRPGARLTTSPISPRPSRLS